MPKYTKQQLQEAIKHAKREPDAPMLRIADLYGVDRQTLCRRVLGTQQERSIVHQDQQLFSTGDEKAIAGYAGIMADAGFPLGPELLRQIAQGIVNERQITQHGPSRAPSASSPSTSNPSTSSGSSATFSNPSSSMNTPIHIVGVSWRTYERNLSTWLRRNPLLGISKLEFLDILQQTRREVFTNEIIRSAWRASRCWPIDRTILPPQPPAASFSVTSAIAASAGVSAAGLDTPARLRQLSRIVIEQARRKLNKDDELKGMVYELIDFAEEKVTKYRDIAPHAETLNKLRDGKIRKTRKRSRHVGEARVLTYQYVNEGIKKLADTEAAKAERRRIAKEKKKVAEEKRVTKEALDKQWRYDLQQYQAVEIPVWQAECAEIDQAWAASKAIAVANGGSKRIGKKPSYPTRPKRPLKPKGGGAITSSDLTIIAEDILEEGANSGIEGGAEEGEDEEDLVDSMRTLDIAYFAEGGLQEGFRGGRFSVIGRF
ncbi:hypothetical protein L211DRAFT_874882 [Terfezia boudieri ATCC MYA-4762]|uniref:Uncharacterized protein n=1 Tax=Terfezia boudieri ATCC MYA-4762 TaxID=1051890 RepID=A0A3N4LA88_9PEZI|nr:hypothetical protein L211DRAFT_874882 [Terfezia boudieri ATCC MYA-4762]